ncbi:acyl carrier protein [Nocardia tengchongensis]|uniref:acyl carrier protein n=1 Tax=Nocardia tengchongensis TaxID=2055889 RepID=UPI0036779338
MGPTVPAQRNDVAVDWLTARVAEYLGCAPAAVDPALPLAELGLDSVSAVNLCGEIEFEWDVDVDPTVVFDYPTIRELGAYIIAEAADRTGYAA